MKKNLNQCFSVLSEEVKKILLVEVLVVKMMDVMMSHLALVDVVADIKKFNITEIMKNKQFILLIIRHLRDIFSLKIFV